MNAPTRKSNYFQRHAFQIGLFLILMGWTPLLTTYTLSIQHSDYPLIKPVPKPTVEPHLRSKTSPAPEPDFPPDSNEPNGTNSNPVSEWIEENPLPASLLIGLVGAGIVVLFGAPILVVTGVGAAVSMASSYIISH